MTGNAALSLGIEALLRRRGAWLSDHGLCLERACARADATRAIADDFPAFELVRDAVVRLAGKAVFGSACERALRALMIAGVVVDNRTSFAAIDADADRYLRGGWLEEYAGLAALAAGADEVRIGQKVGWIAKGFEGVNEIDAIARFGDRLVFVSAKGLRSRLVDGDVRHRMRLMNALQEADNLVDHFGDANSAVVLLVTTDLWDERRREPRYEQLHGKAAALGVALVSLEDVGWETLVAVLKKLGTGGGGGV